jgi:membrane-associated phospholipid phosphatase
LMGRSHRRFANKISLIFSAPSLAFIAVVIFALFSPIGMGPFLTQTPSILLGTLFLCVLPIIPVVYYAKRGIIDIDISDRSKRPKFFAMSLVGYSLGAIIFGILYATSLMALSIAYVCVTSSIAVISFSWKVSVHTSAIAGPVTGLTYVFGWIAALMYLLLLPIGWARLRLRAHSPWQLVAGSVVAVLVTFTVYIVFYPAPPKSWL